MKTPQNYQMALPGSEAFVGDYSLQKGNSFFYGGDWLLGIVSSFKAKPTLSPHFNLFVGTHYKESVLSLYPEGPWYTWLWDRSDSIIICKALNFPFPIVSCLGKESSGPVKESSGPMNEKFFCLDELSRRNRTFDEVILYIYIYKLHVPFVLIP